MNRRGFLRSAIATAVVGPVLAKLGVPTTVLSPYAQYVADNPVAFIPEIWSQRMIENFYPSTVMAEIENTSVLTSAKVEIRTTPDIATNGRNILMDAP